jgi:hypothetical protein
MVLMCISTESSPSDLSIHVRMAPIQDYPENRSAKPGDGQVFYRPGGPI